jgi:hypothetical protein
VQIDALIQKISQIYKVFVSAYPHILTHPFTIFYSFGVESSGPTFFGDSAVQ